MNTISFLFIILISILISTYISFFDNSSANIGPTDSSSTKEENILEFSKNSPTLLSILLASVLASLAVILGMLGLDELKAIQKIEEKLKKELFDNLMKNLAWDIYPILAAFIISSFLSIFSIKGTYFIVPIIDVVPIEIYKIIFVINFFLLSVSLYVTYDIICGLFNISKIKYESVKHKH